LSNLTLEAAASALPMAETGRLLIQRLCQDNPDAPFALLYLVAGDRGRLSSSVGVDPSLAPAFVDCGQDDFWSIARVLAGEDLVSIDHDQTINLPGGLWPEQARQHVAMALYAGGPSGPPIGVLIVGVNSRLRLDENYRDFLRLVRVQLSSSLSAVRGLEREATAAKTREVLLTELQHRSRNLLAIVQAISNRTAATSASVETFQSAFQPRLAALARAEEFLTRAIELPPLRGLVALELDILSQADRARVTIGGPDVSLARNEAQLILAALHELTTNALKYGALKDPGGGLEIAWAIEPQSKLVRLDWRETLRSPATIATRQGFGRRLIEDALPSHLQARTEFKLLPAGLRCSIEIPIARDPSVGALSV
jgi:two-component sensor histidine kinase